MNESDLLSALSPAEAWHIDQTCDRFEATWKTGARPDPADYLGSAATNDPRWFDHSLQQTAATRALDQDPVPCSTPEMLDALPADDSKAPYDPYPLVVITRPTAEAIGNAVAARPGRTRR